eukprot:COSAG01_NODE_1302_length_10819_cov_17.534515_2_plen_175_part_00
MNFESIIVSLSSSHEYFPLVKLVGHIKVRHSARCVHVCAVRSLPDEAIWRLPYYLSLKKSLPFFKRRWNNRNNSGIISGIISESDSSIIPIPSGLGRLSQDTHRPTARVTPLPRIQKGVRARQHIRLQQHHAWPCLALQPTWSPSLKLKSRCRGMWKFETDSTSLKTATTESSN